MLLKRLLKGRLQAPQKVFSTFPSPMPLESVPGLFCELNPGPQQPIKRPLKGFLQAPQEALKRLPSSSSNGSQNLPLKLFKRL
jgi:hypothetical protein